MKKIRSTTGRFWFGNAVVLTSVLLGLVGAGRAWAADGDDLALPQNKDGTYTLLTNINDDDGDGVPDYADLNNPKERNIRKLEIDVDDIRVDYIYDKSHAFSLTWRPTDVVFSTSNSSFTVPAAELWNGRARGSRGYMDFQPLRSNGHVRIWTKDPTKARSPKNIFTKVATNWSDWPWEASFSLTNLLTCLIGDPDPAEGHWHAPSPLDGNGHLIYMWTPLYAPNPLTGLWYLKKTWKEEHIDDFSQPEDFGLTNKWGKITLWLEGLEPGRVDLTCRTYGYTVYDDDYMQKIPFNIGSGDPYYGGRYWPGGDSLNYRAEGFFYVPWSPPGWNPNNAFTLSDWNSLLPDYKQEATGVLLWETNYAINVAEANLGINNNENMDDTDGLRVGVPDVAWKIDGDDEALEDQLDGMPFWVDMNAKIGPRSLVNMMPLSIQDDGELRKAGYAFYLCVRGEGTVRVQPRSHWQSKGSDLLNYLKTDAMAQAQLKVADQEKTIGTTPVKIPVNYDVSSFLVRSADVGSRIIELLVKPPGSAEYIPADSVKVDFRNVRTLISMMNARNTGTSPYVYPVEDGRTFDMQRFNDAIRQDGAADGIDLARKNYHVFVHGYSVDPNGAISSSAQIYKSMYWTGFRGNFIGFSWNGNLGGVNVENYNVPMQDAMRTAPALANMVETTLNRTYGAPASRITLFAHSLGNMVAFDALRLWQYRHPGQKAVRALTAIEPAISESMFWPVEDFTVNYFPHYVGTSQSKTFTVDIQKRVSRAFWANQPGHEAIRSAGTLIHCWNYKDFALNLAFAANDMGRRVLKGNPIDQGLAEDQWPEEYRIPYCKDDCAAGTVDFVYHAAPLPMPGSTVRASTQSAGTNAPYSTTSYDNEIAQGRKPMPRTGAYAAAINLKAVDYGWDPKSHSAFAGGDLWGPATGPGDVTLGSVWRWYEQVHRTGGYVIGEE